MGRIREVFSRYGVAGPLVGAVLLLLGGIRSILDWVGLIDQVKSMMTPDHWLTKVILWPPLGIVVSVIGFCRLAFLIYKAKPLGKADAAIAATAEPPLKTDPASTSKPVTDWIGLSARLKELCSEGINAHLLFVGGKRPTVDRIRSAFDSAGWETSFVSSPFDQHPQGGVGRYYSGIEVKGHDLNLVEAVTAALLGAGLEGVYTTVEPHLKMAPGSPKWNRIQHRVTIMVGHDKG